VRALIIGEAGEAVKAVWGDALSAPGPVYGGGSGGQFRMDPGELQKVIGMWEDELKKIVEDGVAINELTNILKLAPGGDPASGSYASTVTQSIASLQTQNDSMRTYAQDYIKKLKDAQAKTVTTDQGMAHPFTQAT